MTLLIGTDSGIPMNFHSAFHLARARRWVTDFGVDPMIAIRAATYWPSVAMKVESQVGTVTPGKYADIIAVRGDVLRYIDLLQRVGCRHQARRQVQVAYGWKRGRLTRIRPASPCL